MLNCRLNPNGTFSYISTNFDKENKIISWNKKKCNFCVGDFFRVKGKNGYTSEVEIKEIHEDGFVETIDYSSFRWYSKSKKKMHKKGKMTHSVGMSSFYAEHMFFDLQCRGQKFHKIKKLSPKYQRIKTHWETNW